MDLLNQYLTGLSSEKFNTNTLAVLKILMDDKVYFTDDILTISEAIRIRFRPSGMPAGYSRNQRRMILINLFILKTFIPEVFCLPETRNFNMSISSTSRLSVKPI